MARWIPESSEGTRRWGVPPRRMRSKPQPIGRCARTPSAITRRCSSPRPRRTRERGVDASLEDIARRAGVGIGTLYRHFPTRDALNEAVYRREVTSLCDGVAELTDTLAPVEALRTWMRSFARYVAKKRGMAMALKSALGPDNELFTYSHAASAKQSEPWSTRAVESGTIRADVDADDLLRAMSGICMATDSPGWSDRSRSPGQPARRRTALRRAPPA